MRELGVVVLRSQMSNAFCPWPHGHRNVLFLMVGFGSSTRSSAQEILGATIVGPGAGDHISEAVRKGMPRGCSHSVVFVMHV